MSLFALAAAILLLVGVLILVHVLAGSVAFGVILIAVAALCAFIARGGSLRL